MWLSSFCFPKHSGKYSPRRLLWKRLFPITTHSSHQCFRDQDSAWSRDGTTEYEGRLREWSPSAWTSALNLLPSCIIISRGEALEDKERERHHIMWASPTRQIWHQSSYLILIISLGNEDYVKGDHFSTRMGFDPEYFWLWTLHSKWITFHLLLIVNL